MAKVVFKIGDDISTDVIYPGRYMATVLPTETPQFAFANDAAINQRLVAKEIPPGSVIVAEKNFGCGSSREQAVSCLKGYELTIIAKDFARIFLQNSINLGLRVICCPTIEASENDDLEITDDKIINTKSGKTFPIVALPKSRQAILEAGGLIAFTRRGLIRDASAK
jgi:3-isopropylmalate/(R)-2-methylmalate dehydratase small subunit